VIYKVEVNSRKQESRQRSMGTIIPSTHLLILLHLHGTSLFFSTFLGRHNVILLDLGTLAPGCAQVRFRNSECWVLSEGHKFIFLAFATIDEQVKKFALNHTNIIIIQ